MNCRSRLVRRTSFGPVCRSRLHQLSLERTPPRSRTPASLHLRLRRTRSRCTPSESIEKIVGDDVVPPGLCPLTQQKYHCLNGQWFKRCVSGSSIWRGRYSSGTYNRCFCRMCQACRISALSCVKCWLILGWIWLAFVLKRPDDQVVAVGSSGSEMVVQLHNSWHSVRLNWRRTLHTTRLHPENPSLPMQYDRSTICL